MKNKSISMLRAMAFLFVLLGHSFPDSAYEFISPITRTIHDGIYSFHMPLFFTISGYCMTHILIKEQFSIKTEIIKRAKRLLIPYFSYSIIAILPKLLLAPFMYRSFDLSMLWKIFIGNSPSGTLWYLYCLFFVFLIFILLSRIVRNPTIWLLISVVMYIGNTYLNLHFKFLQYSIFFVGGIFLFLNWEKISSLFYSKFHLVFTIIFYLIIFILAYHEINNEIIFLATSILGFFATLIIVLQIKNINIENKLLIISNNSYGIYLLSPFIQVPIRIFLYKNLNFPYIVCMLLMFILGLLIPYIIVSKILRKNKILKFFLLGEN